MPHTWGVGPHAEHEGLAWYWKRVDVPPGAPWPPPGAALRGDLLPGPGLRERRPRRRARGRAHGLVRGRDAGPRRRAASSRSRSTTGPGLATIPGWAMKLKGSGTLWYDWWHYGGIVRDVALVAQERAAIRRQEIRPRLAAGRATVTTRVFLERFAAGERLTVDAQVLDPSGRAVARDGRGRARRRRAGARSRLSLEVPEPQALALRPAEPLPHGGRGAGRRRRRPRPARGELRHSDGGDPRPRAVAERRARAPHRDDPPRGVAAGGARRDARDDEGRLGRHEGAARRPHPAGALPAAPVRPRLRRPQRRPAGARDPHVAVQRGADEGPEGARPREADDAGDDRAGRQPPEHLRVERLQRERDEHAGRPRLREGDGRAREGARPGPVRDATRTTACPGSPTPRRTRTSTPTSS